VSDRREILPLVIADLTERIAIGTREYGSPLAVESSNDALSYAYDEALDLALYLRQEIERRELSPPVGKAVEGA
jgi:hypothetical protein